MPVPRKSAFKRSLRVIGTSGEPFSSSTASYNGPTARATRSTCHNASRRFEDFSFLCAFAPWREFLSVIDAWVGRQGELSRQGAKTQSFSPSIKFNAPVAASFRNSSFLNSGTRLCKSSMLVNERCTRSLTIARPASSRKPLTQRKPRRRQRSDEETGGQGDGEIQR